MAKRSLLLVDGDTGSQRVLEVSLKKAGFNVTTAQNGKDAVDKVTTAQPDLIISDTHMDEMDGFEFCRALKDNSEWAEIPFIFLTNQGEIEHKIRGLELGVDDYLTKPIYIKEILTRIRILLQKKERAELQARRENNTKFAGKLSDMAVVDLIQTIEVSRKSGVIHFQSPDERSATLYFRDGQVIDAESRHAQAEPAVYRLLTWTDGEFEVLFRPVRRKAAITVSTQALLMEGMRQLDEWGRLLEQLPPLHTRFTVVYTELAARLSHLPDELNGILRLFDGSRTVFEVIEESGFTDLECLEVVSKLYFDGIITDEAQAESDAAAAKATNGREAIPLPGESPPSPDLINLPPARPPPVGIAAATDTDDGTEEVIEIAESPAENGTDSAPTNGSKPRAFQRAESLVDRAIDDLVPAADLAEFSGFAGGSGDVEPATAAEFDRANHETPALTVAEQAAVQQATATGEASAAPSRPRPITAPGHYSGPDRVVRVKTAVRRVPMLPHMVEIVRGGADERAPGARRDGSDEHPLPGAADRAKETSGEIRLRQEHEPSAAGPVDIDDEFPPYDSGFDDEEEDTPAMGAMQLAELVRDRPSKPTPTAPIVVTDGTKVVSSGGAEKAVASGELANPAARADSTASARLAVEVDTALGATTEEPARRQRRRGRPSAIELHDSPPEYAAPPALPPVAGDRKPPWLPIVAVAATLLIIGGYFVTRDGDKRPKQAQNSGDVTQPGTNPTVAPAKADAGTPTAAAKSPDAAPPPPDAAPPPDAEPTIDPRQARKEKAEKLLSDARRAAARGETYLALDQVEESLIARRSTKALAYKAKLLLATGNTRGALVVAESVLKSSHRNASAWHTKGMAHHRMNQSAAAKQALERYLVLRPSGSSADRVRKILESL